MAQALALAFGPRYANGHAVRTTLGSSPLADSLPSTFNLQPSTFNLQPSTFNLQPSTFNLQPSTFNLQPSTFNLGLSATLREQPLTKNLINRPFTGKSEQQSEG
ncbi:hypothetical protein [Moorena sp. SIO4A5]|uniref:hypothetical protein n=1 Tax=Moorena sp. SIO4A5 TaxID=2607838 RepID=UPI0025F758FC|nr:hypothetical protein [Moorena sp. SIO4A5]